MTVTSTTRISGPYTGNSVTVDFAFSFKVFATSDLFVVKTTTATGAQTTLALTTDYTVTLNADQNGSPGGTVTLLSAPSSSYKITITSTVANTQSTDITNLGGFYPEVITDALDRATIQIQQMGDRVTRSVKTPLVDGVPGANDMDLPPSATRASQFFVFDANGNPAVASGTGVDTALRTDLGLSTAGKGADLVNFSGKTIAPGTVTSSTIQSASGADESINANGSGKSVLLKSNATTLLTVNGSTGNIDATNSITVKSTAFPAFSASKTTGVSDQTLSYNTLTKITFDATGYDNATAMSSSDFVVPVTGQYLFTCTIQFIGTATHNYQFYAEIQQAATRIPGAQSSCCLVLGTDAVYSVQVTTIASCSLNQHINVYALARDAAGSGTTAVKVGNFCGHLVRPA